MRTKVYLLLLCGWWLAACDRPAPPAQIIVNPPAVLATDTPPAWPTASPTPQIQPVKATTTTVATAVAPTATATHSPIVLDVEPPPSACGQILPLLPANTEAADATLSPDAAALAQMRAIVPAAARPALEQLIAAPQTVGLAVYRAGDEANGVFLNADVQMPLASVSKVITLVAYAEAVAAGELDPLSTITLAELENYYLPNFDLGAHPRAVRELQEAGRVFGDPPAVLLEQLPWMMIRHSSNAASDYLHLLLGQAVMEETAVTLNLTQQTAPCTFLGQFLIMGNHLNGSSFDNVTRYVQNSALYAQDVTLLAEAYTQDADFRAAEQAWRAQRRTVPFTVQAAFTDALNAHGTPQEYAALMARIAMNDLSSGESSFLARRALEWPMQFPDNQEKFSNLGYKNGSLPGVLNVLYYAYPLGETTPLVIALFFHDLPNDTYRQWRNALPHDEFARWLLADPRALPALRAVIGER